MSNLAFGVPWTAGEEAVLLGSYAEKGFIAVAAMVGRSVKATQKHARRMGISVKRGWTGADDARLAELWGLHTTRTIAMRLGRSMKAVYIRAAVAGLVARERSGTETLGEAAKRCGYDRREMRRILGRAGVLTTSTSRHSTGLDLRPSYQLDPFEVDEAVAAWTLGSSIIGAARARGVSDGRLRRALALIGITRPAALKPREQWRVADDVADRALASARRAA